jgi:hypothetical protein
MKFFIVAATIFLGLIFQGHAQETIIKSPHLDSLIFARINVYRAQVGVPAIKTFENGPMRKISYALTEANSNRKFIEHSSGDKLFVGYNSECIFKVTTNGGVPGDLTESDLKNLANTVVQAWIDSPNHYWIISCSLAEVATVTTVIKKHGKNLSITASYHAKNKKVQFH